MGYQCEVLNPDAARSGGSSALMEKQGGTSWRVGEVVNFDVATGEHEVSFLDGSESRCYLFLQTMRWLPTKYEPFGTVPEPPPEGGGMMMASPPLPVGCGGMRGMLLPGGKRGEELVRYAAPRDASTPGVMAEFTVPATEFERLGGKGTAKKWRQSLRLVHVGSYKLGETMGRWLRTLGNLTGDASVGRHLEIFWPGDGAFYGGTVAAYKTETGEHEVYYDDGGKEKLQLSMQTVRWGPAPAPGARERMLKLVAEETERAKNEKGKKKSGGGGGGRGGGGGGGGRRGGETDRVQPAAQPAATTTSGSRATRAANGARCRRGRPNPWATTTSGTARTTPTGRSRRATCPRKSTNRDREREMGGPRGGERPDEYVCKLYLTSCKR